MKASVRQQKAKEAVERRLRTFVSQKPGWEFIEVGRLRAKSRLTPSEKKELVRLERVLRKQAEEFGHTNRVPRCTCKGKFENPSKDCPVHRLYHSEP